MARISGMIGYSDSQETRPGIYEEVVTEYKYRGDLLRNSRGLADEEKVIGDVKISNKISIVASAYHREHYFEMLYITFQGQRWKAQTVEVAPPRLNITLGGLYNGPTPETPSSSG